MTAISCRATVGIASRQSQGVRGLPFSATLATARISMTTKLEKELKREIQIDGKPYTLTLLPNGMKLTEKGRRIG